MKSFRNKFWLLLKKIFRIVFFSLGIFSFILIIFSFTRVPYNVHTWLGTHGSESKFYPDEIVLLGGSGMPSESNLIRIYWTSVLSQKFSLAKILIVHPKDESVIAEIRNQLLQNGIDSSKIEIEKRGTNTHDQAMNIGNDFPSFISKNILIVTSPENMLRSVKTFRKIGFHNVGGQAAFETAMFVDLGYDFRKNGGKIYVPDVSKNLALRYNFWNYLKLEITCLREFVALGYYKLNGWI